MAAHADRTVRRNPVVLFGAHSRAGKAHEDVYCRLGVEVYRAGAQCREGRLFWQDAIVDVCGPPGECLDSVAWVYERGARRFLVGEPGARSLTEWRAIVDSVAGSQVLGVQSYLFSEAFRIARAQLPHIDRITSSFSRPRADDDSMYRGDERLGNLIDIFHAELPHQVAMALSVCPALEVAGSAEHAFGPRGGRRDAAVSCSVELRCPGTTAVLSSNLRASRQRWIRFASADGQYVHCDFPVTAAGTSRVYRGDGRGVVKLLFGGEDDMVGACLSAALRAFESGEAPPHELSADLVTSVERCVDNALSKATACRARPALAT
jgi:hypothetical protein